MNSMQPTSIISSQYNFSSISTYPFHPRSHSSIKISITVLDANDNKPVFDQASYETSVPENAPRGTNIIRVHATDADLDSNRVVKYKISSQTTFVYGDLFGVYENTGMVYLRGELDREKVSRYQLVVSAEDQGEIFVIYRFFITKIFSLIISFFIAILY